MKYQLFLLKLNGSNLFNLRKDVDALRDKCMVRSKLNRLFIFVEIVDVLENIDNILFYVIQICRNMFFDIQNSP